MLHMFELVWIWIENPKENKIGNKLEIPQEKWYKSFSEGNIIIKNTSYDLVPNNLKRELIYKENNGENILIGTSNKVIKINPNLA